jgi:hypothetical protein
MLRTSRWAGEQIIFELPNKLGQIVVSIGSIEGNKINFDIEMPRCVRWFNNKQWDERTAALDAESKYDAVIEKWCKEIDMKEHKAKAFVMD